MSTGTAYINLRCALKGTFFLTSANSTSVILLELPLYALYAHCVSCIYSNKM